MAAILGVILKLPPVAQALASRQLQSRYLERLIAADSGVLGSGLEHNLSAVSRIRKVDS
jgi:hypothetical protein